VEECLYRHIDPITRVGVCPWYERGFCPLGPDCSKRHVKGKRLCQMYLTGFCPLGKECPDAQYLPSSSFTLTLVPNMKNRRSHQNESHRNSIRLYKAAQIPGVQKCSFLIIHSILHTIPFRQSSPPCHFENHSQYHSRNQSRQMSLGLRQR